MLEMKLTITAPELSEAINNLARAMTVRAETIPNGTTICAVPTNTTCVPAEATESHSGTPAATEVNPTTPASVPQTAKGAPNTPSANYPTPDANNSTPPVSAVPTAPVAQTVPTAPPQYTLDMISRAGTALIDAGKMSELTALLARYGVEALTTLDPAYYGAFANELRALGASI